MYKIEYVTVDGRIGELWEDGEVFTGVQEVISRIAELYWLKHGKFGKYARLSVVNVQTGEVYEEWEF